LELGYVWLSKLHALATGRLYNVFLLCPHTLLLSELKSAELWVLWTRVPACRTDAQPLRRDAKTTVLWERPQNEPFTPDFPVHTRWMVCGTSI